MLKFGNAELHNVAEIVSREQDERGIFNRLPSEVRNNCLDSVKNCVSYRCAGCEIRFRIKGENVKVTLMSHNDLTEQGVAQAELYFGSFGSAEQLFIRTEPTTFTIAYPYNLETLNKVSKDTQRAFDPELVRIVLPYDAEIELISIEGEYEVPLITDKPSKTLMTYGSSITNGASVFAPAIMYSFQTAEKLGMDYRNLGFAGSAKLEPAMANYIAEEGQKGKWDVLTLEMGINMLWQSVTKMRTPVDEFESKVNYFVDTIVNANPDKKIYCIDLFITEEDVFCLEDDLVNQFRKVVKDKVASLNSPNVFHIDGRNVLSDPTMLSFDLLHPASRGNDVMAENLFKILSEK